MTHANENNGAHQESKARITLKSKVSGGPKHVIILIQCNQESL